MTNFWKFFNFLHSKDDKPPFEELASKKIHDIIISAIREKASETIKDAPNIVNHSMVVTDDGYRVDLAINLPSTIYIFDIRKAFRHNGSIGAEVFDIAKLLRDKVDIKYSKACFIYFVSEQDAPTAIDEKLFEYYKCHAYGIESDQLRKAIYAIINLVEFDNVPKNISSLSSKLEQIGDSSEILQLLLRGFTSEEIAKNLDTDTSVVEQILDKTLSSSQT